MGLPAFARPAVSGGWGRWSQTLGQHVVDAAEVSHTDSDASQTPDATAANSARAEPDRHPPSLGRRRRGGRRRAQGGGGD